MENEFKELTKNYINNDDIFYKLEKYFNLIEKYNKVMNLTGFKGERLWNEGIYQSIISLETAFGNNINGKLLDIGAGAGFPSVPFLISNPNLELTIFEPQQKRVKFLEIVKKELDLNLKIINTRVEDYNQREIFNFITARAVSSLKNLLMACSHTIKIGGTYGFIKGPKYQLEIDEASKVLHDLKLKPFVKKVKLDNKNTVIIKMIQENKVDLNYPKPWKEIVSKK